MIRWWIIRTSSKRGFRFHSNDASSSLHLRSPMPYDKNKLFTVIVKEPLWHLEYPKCSRPDKSEQLITIFRIMPIKSLGTRHRQINNFDITRGLYGLSSRHLSVSQAKKYFVFSAHHMVSPLLPAVFGIAMPFKLADIVLFRKWKMIEVHDV